MEKTDFLFINLDVRRIRKIPPLRKPTTPIYKIAHVPPPLSSGRHKLMAPKWFALRT